MGWTGTAAWTAIVLAAAALCPGCEDASPPPGGAAGAIEEDAAGTGTTEPEAGALPDIVEPSGSPETSAPEVEVHPACDAPGGPCEVGCLLGTCSLDLGCEKLEPKPCPEVDGNLCSEPTCFGAGECAEVVISDGEPPYSTSECFSGALCFGGALDETTATPSPLAGECEALGADLDPYGCHGGFVCVGGTEGCKPVQLPDGTPCWPEAGGESGDTCLGHLCDAGECVPASGLDIVCDEDDWPDGCGEACRQCTSLSCHWIPDPASLIAEAKTKVRYCQPEAEVGTDCASDACLSDMVCAFDLQAEGPLGKETTGLCSGGSEKTPAECLDELAKPALPCLLAGVGCASDEGGCYLEQAESDAWCLPPDKLCYDKAETYCTHLDGGASWDPGTGCHTGWVEIDCDDANPCTLDTCVGPTITCVHEPLDGSPCDDGDACTTSSLCIGSSCEIGQPKCTAGDGNPCTIVTCNSLTGACEQEAIEGGASCDDGNGCTTGTLCLAGFCAGGSVLDCEDGNPCTTGGCDPATGCVQANNAEPCEDGSLCTVGDQCVAGECVPGEPPSCPDDNPDDCIVPTCSLSQGCTTKPAVEGTACGPNEAWACDKGDCLCQPQCDGSHCGFDGCFSSCACEGDATCTDDLDCEVPVLEGDYDGDWYITANPSTQYVPELLGNATFYAMVLAMTFTETTAAGSGDAFGTPLNYTGTRSGDTFTLKGTYSEPLGSTHSETWNCTFQSPTLFTGTLVDDVLLLGVLPATLSWNIQGDKQ